MDIGPGATVYSHHDYRLAMAFASLGAAVGDIVVDNADAVEKTYPAFWSDVEALGGGLGFTVEMPLDRHD